MIEKPSSVHLESPGKQALFQVSTDTCGSETGNACLGLVPANPPVPSDAGLPHQHRLPSDGSSDCDDPYFVEGHEDPAQSEELERQQDA